MSAPSANAGVALLMTVAVGLLAGGAWPAYVMGSILAMSLALGLIAGSFAVSRRPGRPRLEPASYLAGAVVAVALGRILGGGEPTAFWAVGTIAAIAVTPVALRFARAAEAGDEPSAAGEHRG